METLEVHSKDFLVKWVYAPDNSIIDWQVKPLKKSINFAIYRKNELSEGTKEGSENPIPRSTSSFTKDDVLNGSVDSLGSNISSVNLANSNVYKTRSRSNTFTNNLNHSDLTLVKDYKKLISDELVHGKYEIEKGGVFAFIFDNSFSKTILKKILFTSKILFASPDKNSIYRRKLTIQRKSSTELRLRNGESAGGQDLQVPTPNSSKADNEELLQSVLLKKRRKKLQGFVKRFFILNFHHGTLSYFRVNDNKLRGQMPIKQSIVSANAKKREIIIDSGMEAWCLKTVNAQDFNLWVEAFNEVKKSQYACERDVQEKIPVKSDSASVIRDLETISQKLNTLKFKNDASSESLILNILGISDDVEHVLDKLKSAISTNGVARGSAGDVHSVFSSNEFYDAKEYIDAMNSGVVLLDKPNAKQSINTYSDESADEYEDQESLSSSSSSSGSNDDDDDDYLETTVINNSIAEPTSNDNDDNLYPLPHDPVERDYDIPVCDHHPPSILGFVRKNVGKDLSTLRMPVDINEPISILQKYAEIFEYSELIDNALQVTCEDDTGERILRIAAFAVSFLSPMRVKERNARKPFNPLLGETYELVREDHGIRLISEKVSHRPPVFAMFAESKDWTFSFSPAPNQKFWGKNFEVFTNGICKLTIRSTGELFTWNQPITLLKNIIAGEKYSEPSSEIIVKSSTGFKAIVEFAKSGMFSGRSEDLTIKSIGPNKKNLPYSVTGKWTESLTLKTNTTEKLIWTVGELLPNYTKKYGFTKYAGSLNKITDIERGNLPPTDTRLRPDILVYRSGDVPKAEVLKVSIEDMQREKRKELDISGGTYKPKFFTQVGGDEKSPDTGEWVYITGEKSYWNRRENNDWEDLPSLW